MGVVGGGVPIGAPFPDVAGHVVEPVAVGWEGCDGGAQDEAVGCEIVIGEFALPVVAGDFGLVEEVVAPGEVCVGEPPAGCEFPFGFGGEPFSGPLSIGLGVEP